VRLFSALLLSLPATGCTSTHDDPPVPTAPRPEVGQQFDPANCGRITGRICWSGDLPEVEPFTIFPNAGGFGVLREKQERANPNAPQIDPQLRGVGDAVVYLRGIDLARGRRWDFPPVTVEMRDYRFDVRQGETIGRYGFVRRGDSVTLVSRQPEPQGVHAD